MEISSKIIERWRSLALVTSFICCIIIIFFINQRPQSPTLFSSTSVVVTYTVEDRRQTVPSLVNSTHQQNSSLSATKSGEKIGKGEKTCDIHDGKWVYKGDNNKLIYNASSCPFLEEKMNCRANGRPDFEYENWVWKPRHCDLIQFNGTDLLERLRGKKMIIVGDSMNRNQWESLACLLYSAVDPSQVEGLEVKSRYRKLFRAKEYDFTLEFDFSPFLVKLDTDHDRGRKVLLLDEISESSDTWLDADVLLFNTGHWWVHLGKFKTWDLFQTEGILMEDMKIEVAFQAAMKAWAQWIDQNVDRSKTMVLFRSISPEHHGDLWCYNVTKPIMDESYASLFPQSMLDIVVKTIRKMRTPVKYLNITTISQYRRDAHPGLYRSSEWKVVAEKYKRHIPSFVDCSHWCLPGVPDTWNWLLYTTLISDSGVL